MNTAPSQVREQGFVEEQAEKNHFLGKCIL